MIPLSTERTLQEELKHSELGELEDKAANYWKNRFHNILKEFVGLFLNTNFTSFTIGDICRRIKNEFDISASPQTIRLLFKKDF